MISKYGSSSYTLLHNNTNEYIHDIYQWDVYKVVLSISTNILLCASNIYLLYTTTTNLPLNKIGLPQYV